MTPLRVIELPTRLDVPRFEVAGPVLIDDAARGDSADLAVVASSQLGFAAVDWRRGKVAWTRATGAHVAPPLVLPDGDLVLLSDCALPPDTDEPVLGCARVVTAAGADRSDGAIVGSAALAAAMRDPGPQRTWSLPDHRVAWQRGATALTLDLASGRARQGADAPAPLTVRHRDLELDITLDEDGQLRAHRRGGARALQWQAPGRFAAILGVIPGLAHETPMLRVVRPSIVRSVGTTAAGTSFDILDVDALTASGSQAAVPAPGIQLLASATGARNAAALVVRLDRSLRRDYVIAYTGGARVAWVYPLPDALRSDAVGVAVEKDAVLVFHDGDTLTVLPPIE